ncbi:MAG TPA: MarR family transcriptional regulator, partial [Acidimicrobiales bacterium]
AVRTVDRLAGAGLVVRRPAPDDRRRVALRLTDLGEHRRRLVLEARNRALAAALAPLDPTERRALGGLIDTLLTGIAAESGDHSMCRLCDPGDCTGWCPVDAAGDAAAAGE